MQLLTQKGNFKKYYILAGVSVMVLLLIPAVRKALADFLIPGDPNVTSSAFSDLISQLIAGQPVGQAIQTFCRTVIVNG